MQGGVQGGTAMDCSVRDGRSPWLTGQEVPPDQNACGPFAPECILGWPVLGGALFHLSRDSVHQFPHSAS